MFHRNQTSKPLGKKWQSSDQGGGEGGRASKDHGKARLKVLKNL